MQNGVTVTKWGFFGDIVLGPYVSFGIESEEEKLFEKRNNAHVYVSALCLTNEYHLTT
jgi:dynein assembly factor 3